MTKDNTQRKMIEIAREDISLFELLNSKEIREAAKSIENCRLLLNEQEILFGAKLFIEMDNYYKSRASLVARRPETDKEQEARLKKLKRAAEKRAENSRKRKLAEQALKEKQQEVRKKTLIKDFRKLAESLNITVDELSALAKTA